MKYRAPIASADVGSDDVYVVYSPTKGVIGSASDRAQARQILEEQMAQCRERGRESDAMLFEWREDHWRMSGSLYDQPAESVRGGRDNAWPY